MSPQIVAQRAGGAIDYVRQFRSIHQTAVSSLETNEMAIDKRISCAATSGMSKVKVELVVMADFVFIFSSVRAYSIRSSLGQMERVAEFMC